MKRGLINIPLVVLLLIGIQTALSAQDDDIPLSLRNNRYYMESLRYNNMARLAFNDGDYDASTQYSEEAVRYANLSDEYVYMRLRMKAADDAIAAARSRLDFAASLNAASRYPLELGQAQDAYNEARAFRAQELWDEAIEAANRVLLAIADIERLIAMEPEPEPESETDIAMEPEDDSETDIDLAMEQDADSKTEIVMETESESETDTAIEPPADIVMELEQDMEDGKPPSYSYFGELLPGQYVVRTWEDFADCLWNIAGYPWVYNDPTQWRILYEANRHRMPQPDNPDLIHPGMILDIPSIQGETREGMWDTRISYVIPPPEPVQFPGQYTVRPWSVASDCLWNIAGYPWVYNDPTKWRILYEANRSKMPQPDNPDLIHPGMILDIPSLKGEARSGMWDSGRTYSILQ